MYLSILKKLVVVAFTAINCNAIAQSSPQVDQQCENEYNRIIAEATEAQKIAAQKGDFAEVTRWNLVRSIKIRNLYSAQCSDAPRAKSRRELGQRGVDMSANFCQQWNMGDQCAAPPVIKKNAPSSSTNSASNSIETPMESTSNQTNQRKTHDASAEASACIAIDQAGSGNFGAFKNLCNYAVNFYTCNEGPRMVNGGFNWSADFDCSKQKFGLHTPGPNASVAAHNRNTERVYWTACKAPASPVDAEYVPGQGILARCR